ncbi:MAG: hypothetical protein K8S15_09080 [Candidatus Aegiribacteria sp.]|nr:hypothetical protein [Candidatus Aegiribacteria sp.]
MSIDEERAIEIAKMDAANVYRDLSVYDVVVSEGEGVWIVRFVFSDKDMVGGGPEYEISMEDGAIVKKIYSQ